MNISPAVQARMNELREKEAAAKAQEEFLKQELIKGIATEVSLKSDDWEAELLFEIEKTPGFMDWLRKKLQSPTAFDTAQKAVWRRPSSRMLPDGQIDCYSPLLTVEEMVENVIAEIPLPSICTLENERIRLRCRIVKNIIESVKESIKAEELAAKQKRVEAARVAAEEKAAAERVIAEEKAAAARAQQTRRLAQADIYYKRMIALMKTPWHTFTGVGADQYGPVMYIHYSDSLKQLRIYNYHLSYGDNDSVTGVSHPLPPSMKAPVEWNDMFEKGRLPFLTCCPVCSAQVTFEGITPNGQIYDVRCQNHYSWDPVKNQNYKYKYIPPKGPSFSHPIFYHPEAWDPRDPDGSKAARAARDKKIAETEAEIGSLQAKLEALKKA